MLKILKMFMWKLFKRPVDNQEVQISVVYYNNIFNQKLFKCGINDIWKTTFFRKKFFFRFDSITSKSK